MPNAMVNNVANMNVPVNATSGALLAPRWGGDKPAYMNSPTGNSPNIPQPGQPASFAPPSPNYGSASAPTYREQYAPEILGGLPQAVLDASAPAAPSTSGRVVASWVGKGDYNYVLQEGGSIRVVSAPTIDGKNIAGTVITPTSNNRAYVAILEEFMTEHPTSSMAPAVQVALNAAKPLLPTVYEPSVPAGQIADPDKAPFDWNKAAWIVGGLLMFTTAAAGGGYWYYRRRRKGKK